MCFYYQMFKYIKLADFLQTLVQRKCQLKDIIYSQQSTHSTKKGHKAMQVKVNPGVAYSNLSLILNNINQFQEMYAQLCQAMKKKKQKIITNKYLLFTMVAELLNVGKIVGGGKIKKIILENSHLIPNIAVESKINKQTINIRLRKCDDQRQYKKWEQIMNNYKQNTVIQHLYDLDHLQYSKLISAQPTLLTTYACVIQSFSSNLPPFLLFRGLDTPKNQKISFDIIDACSAPGNKTLQLSEYLGDRGTVYAFEKDERRFKTLCKNMLKYCVTNVYSVNTNFLSRNPEDEMYQKVKLILLDPSCSGSGMLTNFTRDGSLNIQQQQAYTPFEQFVKKRFQELDPKQQQRILSLKAFQLQLLNHTAKFKPQRISYSTCSIFCQQNEQVVQQFLAKHPEYYIKPVAKQLPNYDCMVPGFGSKFRRCIRIDPRLKISDGFFVCIFGLRKKDHLNGNQNMK